MKKTTGYIIYQAVLFMSFLKEEVSLVTCRTKPLSPRVTILTRSTSHPPPSPRPHHHRNREDISDSYWFLFGKWYSEFCPKYLPFLWRSSSPWKINLTTIPFISNPPLIINANWTMIEPLSKQHVFTTVWNHPMP